MLSRRRVARGLLASALIAVAACGGAAAQGREEVTVFAAASLREVCTELGQRFETERGVRVVFNFAGSNLLASQILAGAPCDLFLSAGAPQMDQVEAAGLLAPGLRVALLTNALVVIQPEPLPGDLPALVAPADLADPRLGRLALADPRAVPAGTYARAWLEQLGLWERVAERVVPAIDVRSALALVESGAAGAGVVYATDAAITTRARVAWRVPPEAGPAIVYPAAVLREARAPQAARELLAFLRSEPARELLERHGFGVPEGG
jgi:molybdate transport system substrate-binding protein